MSKKINHILNKFRKTISAIVKKGSGNKSPPPNLPNQNNKVDFQKYLSWPFRHEHYHSIDRICVLLCVGLGCYLFGKTTARVVFPMSVIESQEKKNIVIADTPSPALKNFERGNNFDLKSSSLAKKEIKKEKKKEIKKDYPICEDARRKTSLGIDLISLTVLKNPKKSLAEVKLKRKKEVQFLRYGQKIPGVGKVGLMKNKKLFIRNFSNGNCEYVATKEKRKSKKLPSFKVHSENERDRFFTKNERIKNEGNSFKIKESLREEMLGNISSVLTQARAIPITNGDGTLSFKITEITPGSIYSQLNIQEDDIITGINGKNVTSINEVTSLLGKIRDITSLSITVERDGEEKTQDYSFEK